MDTVSAVHSLEPLLNLLKHHGKLIMVGVPSDSLALPVLQIVSGKHIIYIYIQIARIFFFKKRKLVWVIREEDRGRELYRRVERDTRND